MNRIVFSEVWQRAALAILSFLLFCAPELYAASSGDVLLHGQEFHCNTGYRVPDCLREIRQLQSELQHYDLAPLGSWTWVLVRSDQWRPLMYSLGLNPTAPALTELDQRTTFLDEALLAPDPVRGAELLHTFRIPLDQLLDLAVTHELGHAMCGLLSEAEADRLGEALRTGKPVSCPNRPDLAFKLKPSFAQK